MNLRDKFLWHLGILLSVLTIGWNGWNLHLMNNEAAELLLKFKKEVVGTDKELEKKVLELENIYLKRSAMRFVMADNPVDLNRVISLDGISNSKRRKNLWVSGIINKTDDIPMALINLKDRTYNVVKGDSIGGGVILDITSTKVVFKKNEKIHTYNLGIDNNIE